MGNGSSSAWKRSGTALWKKQNIGGGKGEGQFTIEKWSAVSVTAVWLQSMALNMSCTLHGCSSNLTKVGKASRYWSEASVIKKRIPLRYEYSRGQRIPYNPWSFANTWPTVHGRKGYLEKEVEGEERSSTPFSVLILCRLKSDVIHRTIISPYTKRFVCTSVEWLLNTINPACSCVKSYIRRRWNSREEVPIL